MLLIVKQEGFFSGVVKGTPEYETRMTKAMEAFNKRYPPTSSTDQKIEAPAASELRIKPGTKAEMRAEPAGTDIYGNPTVWLIHTVGEPKENRANGAEYGQCLPSYQEMEDRDSESGSKREVMHL